MKSLCVLALIPFCCGAVETDNVEHASVSAAIGAIFIVAFQKTDHPMLYAAGATLAIGLAKECYDARSGGSGFSKQDLAADAV
jgi:hypothetical protein